MTPWLKPLLSPSIVGDFVLLELENSLVRSSEIDAEQQGIHHRPLPPSPLLYRHHQVCELSWILSRVSLRRLWRDKLGWRQRCLRCVC
ncbi:hypothetical protein LINGRAHAP2_LOCUS34781 [Linum grandiflorum]